MIKASSGKTIRYTPSARSTYRIYWRLPCKLKKTDEQTDNLKETHSGQASTIRRMTGSVLWRFSVGDAAIERFPPTPYLVALGEVALLDRLYD